MGPSRGRADDDASPERATRRPTPTVEIIYTDELLVAAVKPIGLATSRDEAKRKPSLQARLERSGELGRLYPVVELPDAMSGVVVFARTSSGRTTLKRALSPRSAHFVEHALAEGRVGPTDVTEPSAPTRPDASAALAETTPTSTEHHAPAEQVAAAEPEPGSASATRAAPPIVGSIRRALSLNRRGVVEVVPTDSTQRDAGLKPVEVTPTKVPPAITHYRVLGGNDSVTLLQLRLDTDLPHQSAAHLASIGHPVAGDRSRSAKDRALAARLGRLALHRSEIRFDHPRLEKPITLRAAVPAIFYEAAGLPVPEGAARDATPIDDAELADVRSDGPSREHDDLDEDGRDDAAEDRDDRARNQASRPIDESDDSSWEHVAGWYSGLLTSGRSDHHADVVHPGTLALLDLQPGERLLDVACGTGDLCGLATEAGVEVVGVDAAPTLIATARDRVAGARFEVADARALPSLELGEPFDAASCVLALMNIDPIGPVLAGIASKLRSRGRLVLVVLHPAFRQIGRSEWAWPGDGRSRQLRAVAGYLSEHRRDVVMNPGEAAGGRGAVTTVTFNRPIQSYAAALADAGLAITAIEEWPSLRMSEPGPRAAAENRARAEIPMFLAVRAVRLA